MSDKKDRANWLIENIPIDFPSFKDELRKKTTGLPAVFVQIDGDGEWHPVENIAYGGDYFHAEPTMSETVGMAKFFDEQGWEMVEIELCEEDPTQEIPKQKPVARDPWKLVTCPECKGKKEIALFTGVVKCEPCNGLGKMYRFEIERMWDGWGKDIKKMWEKYDAELGKS